MEVKVRWAVVHEERVDLCSICAQLGLSIEVVSSASGTRLGNGPIWRGIGESHLVHVEIVGVRVFA